MLTGPEDNPYLHLLAERLTADGCQVKTENWGSPVLVGQRADFRFQWFATRLHLFTVAGTAPRVDLPTLQAFTNKALDLAKLGLPLGAQVGVAVFPTLVSDQVDDVALRWAAEKQRIKFARMARPVVVDTSRGIIAAYRGTPMLGWVYSGHLRRKLDAYFPPLSPAG